MTREQAKEQGFTHSGFMFEKIPVFIEFFYDDSFRAVGKTKLYDAILHVLLFIDDLFQLGKGFEIWTDYEKL